jgi:hypothetical protein
MRLAIAGALLFVSIQLTAATIVIDPNPLVMATSITSNVTGADLAGLLVIATYLEPSASPPFMVPVAFPMTWAATGPASGAASTSGPGGPIISVSVNGNASGNLAWSYQSNVLSPPLSLDLDGTAAGIYFDRAHTGPGTPGSGAGADIAFGPPLSPPGSDASFVVTYAGAVALDGNPPDNDLYAKLMITFPTMVGGPFFAPTDFTFTQPTDRNIVPEPASWLLIATGLAATGILAGRRREIS